MTTSDDDHGASSPGACAHRIPHTDSPHRIPHIGFPTGEDGTGGGDPELVYDCLTRVRLSCFNGAHSELVRAGVLRVTIAAMKAHMKSDASIQIVACEVRVIVLDGLWSTCLIWMAFGPRWPSKGHQRPSKGFEGASAESTCLIWSPHA